MVAHAAWNYCPLCGGEVVKDRLHEGENTRVRCSSCPFQDFDSPWPSVTVLIENEDAELLLLKRAIAPAVGEWDTPGGFMTAGETGEEAARREVFEELTVVLGALTYLGSFPGVYGEEEKATIAQVYRAFLKKDLTFVVDPEENDEARWFSSQEIPPLPFQDGRMAVEAWRELKRREDPLRGPF